jgi:hypothetical protein
MTDTKPADAAASTEVARTDDDLLAEFNDHYESLDAEDTEVLQERILRQLLRSTTAHDILNAGSATKAEEVYGTPIRVEAIRATESDYEEGPNKYLHIDCVVISNGDRLTVSCGASDVVMKLVMLDMRKMLPVDVVIERSPKQSKNGFYPVFLREIPDF